MPTSLEKSVTAGDGTRLHARRTAGPEAAGVPILCANGIGVSTFFWKYLEAHFAPTRPVIVFDYRGHGQSEYPRDLDDLTIESNAEDAARVLDAFGYERAILAGHSMGCQVIYAFAQRFPRRAAMLVPMLGTFGRPVHTFLDRETSSLVSFLVGHRVATTIPNLLGGMQGRLLQSRRARGLMSKIARLGGIIHSKAMPESDLQEYLDHFGALSPLVFFRMAEKMAMHTADPYLEQIEAPTLVVAGTHDIFTPLHRSEEAAARLPNARLLVLQEGSHAGLVEQPELINRELEAFIADQGIDAVEASVEPEPASQAG